MPAGRRAAKHTDVGWNRQARQNAPETDHDLPCPSGRKTHRAAAPLCMLCEYWSPLNGFIEWAAPVVLLPEPETARSPDRRRRGRLRRGTMGFPLFEYPNAAAGDSSPARPNRRGFLSVRSPDQVPTGKQKAATCRFLFAPGRAPRLCRQACILNQSIKWSPSEPIRRFRMGRAHRSH